MTDPVNPYAPPSTDPSAPPIEASLWRIEDDRLLVREHASLPDVCIHGSPPEERGKRRSLPITVSFAWFLPVFFVASLAAAILGSRSAVLVGILIAGALGKRIRVMVFEGIQISRRRRFRYGLGCVVIMGLAGVAIDSLKILDSQRVTLLLWAMFWIVYVAMYFYRLQAFPREKGWYEIKGVAPSAIARLAAIQREVMIRQDEIRERRKR